MENIIDLNKFAGGALSEKVNTELEKILQNIQDPNTDPEKVRKLTVTIGFKPAPHRASANVSIQAKSQMVPVIATQTSIIIEKDIKTGEVLAAEIGGQIAGQTSLEIDEEIAVENKPDVLDLRKVKNK